MNRDDNPRGAAKTPHTTERLVRAIEDFQKGIDCEKNFQILFERYYRPVRQFFARRVFSPEDCQDLTQDTLFRVYKGLRAFRWEAEFETWLLRIAFNTYQKWLGRRINAENVIPRVSIDSADDLDWLVSDEYWPMRPPDPTTPEEELLHRERQQALDQAIAELPERTGQCLRLRLWGGDRGLKNREIAVVMRIAPGTVGALLAQAREKLKQKLEDY